MVHFKSKAKKKKVKPLSDHIFSDSVDLSNIVFVDVLRYYYVWYILRFI
jgi:hypothetical protein